MMHACWRYIITFLNLTVRGSSSALNTGVYFVHGYHITSAPLWLVQLRRLSSHVNTQTVLLASGPPCGKARGPSASNRYSHEFSPSNFLQVKRPVWDCRAQHGYTWHIPNLLWLELFFQECCTCFCSLELSESKQTMYKHAGNAAQPQLLSLLLIFLSPIKVDVPMTTATYKMTGRCNSSSVLVPVIKGHLHQFHA